MANNIISQWIREGIKVRALPSHPHVADYAAKLDRLVAAVTSELKANEVHVFKDGKRTIKYRSVNQTKLAAALAEIELPEEVKDGE